MLLMLLVCFALTSQHASNMYVDLSVTQRDGLLVSLCLQAGILGLGGSISGGC